MVNLPDGLLDRFTAEHPYPRAFLTISGSHIYGFASRDSDVDLRGVHLLPLDEVIGLYTGRQQCTEQWEHGGVEADIVTYDLAKFCGMLLKPNGHALEQLASPLVVETSPLHAELRGHLPGLLTSRHAGHYLGFARSQWRMFENRDELKPLLYVFRTLLTGVHLMRAGELETDLTKLLGDAPPYVPDLVAAKRDAEHAGLPPGAPDRSVLRSDVDALTALLEEERDRSALPERPKAGRALHDLVVRTRLDGLYHS
ncbi:MULTISPECIES: nucleotidyltransferase domain-containing protein [Actinomadura]|uniref:nucleotidyltransferase domain-containing protein n=1 Tax=Actinomadura TaxID=1988 RepID=UPI000415E664|nr:MULTISPECIES: nucleotidyltransferase domain-containing protein [Actinomadura]RSN56814.1 nucleotidyltransferase [Actinomadura sp. WAC 06369]